MEAVFADFVSTAGNGRIPFCVAVNVELSGRLISGPFVVWISWRHCASSSFIKWDVAPLSLFAITIFCLGRDILLLILVGIVVDKHKLVLLLCFTVTLGSSPPHLQVNLLGIRKVLPPCRLSKEALST